MRATCVDQRARLARPLLRLVRGGRFLRGSALFLRAGGGGLLLGRDGLGGGGGCLQQRGIGLIVAAVHRQGRGNAAAARLVLQAWLGWRSIEIVEVPLGALVIANLAVENKRAWERGGRGEGALFGGRERGVYWGWGPAAAGGLSIYLIYINSPCAASARRRVHSHCSLLRPGRPPPPRTATAAPRCRPAPCWAGAGPSPLCMPSASVWREVCRD